MSDSSSHSASLRGTVLAAICVLMQDEQARTAAQIHYRLKERRVVDDMALVFDILDKEGRERLDFSNHTGTYRLRTASMSRQHHSPAPPSPTPGSTVPRQAESPAPASSPPPGPSRERVLKEILAILADGRPRKSKEIAAELTRRSTQDLAFEPSLVASILWHEGLGQVQRDPATFTYTLQSKGSTAASAPPRSTPVPAAGHSAPRASSPPPQPEHRSTATSAPARIEQRPRVERATARGGHAPQGEPAPQRPQHEPQAPAAPPPAFRLRDRVRLRAEPRRRGRIVDGPRPYSGGYEYCVILGDDESWYSEAALEPVPMGDGPRWQDRDAFLRDLLLARLRGQHSDSLYAYRASRTDFVPYQFRPALKFLRNPDQRILIADEVGLGKTIEAAIIYLELKARLDISRVLVLCPSRLKRKWQDELRDRFEEDFEELDSANLRRLLDDARRLGGRLPFRAIASFEMMRSPEFIAAWAELDMQLDLLIVDEAHYMRNPETRTFELGTALTDNAGAVVFLTATPLHLGNRDLWSLLHLLAPGEFDDPTLFESLIAPNAAINRATKQLAAGDPARAAHTLVEVERTELRERFRKNPYYHDVLRRLREGVATDRERIALQRDLIELNTLATLFTRTRKREVTGAAVRAAFTLGVELTPAERRFYDAVLEDVRRELALRTGAQSFATIMRERQAASCLPAMREATDEAARSRSGLRLEVERSAFELLTSDEQPRASQPGPMTTLAREIGDIDSKFDLFARTLDEALSASPASKVLVFSFFRRTLAYLKRRLIARGYRVEVINGEVPVAERNVIIDRFRHEPEIRVLLSSEVGAEGLDFQFCDILFNYDLPWNPMQVEQRIGRLDRFGQQHERIRIYNFYIADTIETRIFQRLYDRIGIFERSIGDLEAILGEEIRQLSEAALRPALTAREQEQLAEQAAARIARHQLDADELEQHKDQLLGQEAIFNEQLDATINSGRVISADEVRALVSSFVRTFPRASLTPDDEEPCLSLRLDADLAAHLEQFILDEWRQNRSSTRLLELLRRGNEIPLTFDSELARKRQLLEFITIRHPLARAAVAYWQQQGIGGIPATGVQIEGPAGEAGEGYFYLYQVTVGGARPQSTLHAIVVHDDGRLAQERAETLLRELARSRPSASGPQFNDEFARVQPRADREVAAHRDTLKEEALRRNAALVAAQQASVRTSFEARIRRAEQQLAFVGDERIRRMRTAEAKNLRARLATRLKELDARVDVTVSSSLIAGGRIRIVPAAVQQPARPEPEAPPRQVQVPPKVEIQPKGASTAMPAGEQPAHVPPQRAAVANRPNENTPRVLITPPPVPKAVPVVHSTPPPAASTSREVTTTSPAQAARWPEPRHSDGASSRETTVTHTEPQPQDTSLWTRAASLLKRLRGG